jgi:hypothetical protein
VTYSDACNDESRGDEPPLLGDASGGLELSCLGIELAAGGK